MWMYWMIMVRMATGVPLYIPGYGNQYEFLVPFKDRKEAEVWAEEVRKARTINGVAIVEVTVYLNLGSE